MTTMNLEKSTNTQQPKPNNPEPKLNFGKHWTGYFAIACSIVVAILILVSRVGAAYGVNLASVMPGETIVAEAKDNGEAGPIVVSVDKVKTPDTGDGDEPDEGWHYYNTDLQEDGILLNDYNFGPNPVLGTPEALESLTKVMERKGLKDTITMEEIAGEVDPAKIDQDFRERMRKDPALGAADMAWADSILGTRYLGTFYSEAKEQWDVAMNDAKEHFINDKDDYYATLDAFEKYLNSATKVEIKKQTSGLNDQMYMNPYTKDEIPDIIVMESADHAGWFLVYTFTIKETATKEIKFRLDCGYQPTNVAEVMKVKAKKNPNKKEKKKKTSTPAPVVTAPVVVTTPAVVTTSGGGHHHSGGGGGHSGGGGGHSDPDPIIPNPDPDPPKPDPVIPNPDPIVPVDPIPNPPKDPTEGTPVLPNDDPGPGENTNNPDNPDYSTKDLPTNSNHMTQEEYDDAMKDNHWANEVGREGGDSNEPSTPAPSDDTKVDNNAENGTGHGGIDTPTDKDDSSVSHDPAGDHWDGPPD